MRYLSVMERAALLSPTEKFADPKIHLLVILALSKGARRGELLGLEWCDIDFVRGRLTFRDTKNGDNRGAVLSALPLLLLQSKLESREEHNPFVFTGGRPDRIFKRLLEEAKIDNFRFHDLRHSAASYLAMQEATLLEIGSILGHRCPLSTRRYAHLCESHTDKLVQQMNALIFGQMVG